MFNANRPSLEELPTTAQLLKSTIIAAILAVVILICVVLPAEYGIDPTRVGSTLGLTEMGEIKSQLAEEAEMDHQSSLLDEILGAFVGKAHAQEAEQWRDEITITLEPGESAEWKMVMTKGQQAFYRMTVTGGAVNFDMHGHGDGQNASYEKARGSTGSEGPLTAEFDGDHGWFWRNRDNADITIKLQLRGDYLELKDES